MKKRGNSDDGVLLWLAPGLLRSKRIASKNMRTVSSPWQMRRVDRKQTLSNPNIDTLIKTLIVKGGRGR